MLASIETPLMSHMSFEELLLSFLSAERSKLLEYTFGHLFWQHSFRTAQDDGESPPQLPLA